MESKQLEKRLDDIDDAIRNLRDKIQDVARYAVRVDKDVENLYVQKLRFPNDERLKALDPIGDRLRQQMNELRQSTRARITGDRRD